MTKSIQQIKTELEALESTVAEAAEELQNLYKNYLDLLSQSVNQQLILASYQICTQFYPQSFLKLSLNQKQELQRSLRDFGKEIQPALLNSSEPKELKIEPKEFNFVAEMIKNLPSPQGQEQEDGSELDLELIKSKLQQIDIFEMPMASESDSEIENKQQIDFNNPEHLILWHKQIEKNIKKNLDLTSKKINKCLQDVGIIPNRVPTKLMEVAIKGESRDAVGNNHKLNNLPNILNLVIETEKEKNSQTASIGQISLLRLRLSEIEFSDPILNAKRTQIRNVVGKISQLRRRYRDKKQECAVAEAEAAWRSSWYEE